MHKTPIPDRKALFDVAVAGPLVGLIVSVIVTLIGLSLPPVGFSPEPGSMVIDLQMPPLFEFLGMIVGYNGEALHPVAFAGWVGMFITLLNLLPTGQLDGGHAMRAMLGEKAKHVSSAMPMVLALVAFYVTYFMNANASIWVFWSFFLLFFAMVGHPTPLDDSTRLDSGRMVVGVITFVLGALCFTLVPFNVVTV
jgi:membrane-associated protease RseP (regulator of RpoE activity)